MRNGRNRGVVHLDHQTALNTKIISLKLCLVLIGGFSLVIVSQELIRKHLQDPKIARMYDLLEKDLEVQTYLEMSNVMAVKRLKYNDHGYVHSRITAGSALEIFDLIIDAITPTTVSNGICSVEDARLVVLCGAYLHDIGNAVHREKHFIHGCYLADPILQRLLSKVYPQRRELALKLKQEILHTIFSHQEEVRCLTVEAGVAKVADGTDMAGGRARIPYKKGKVDIHSLSALAIDKVEILRGRSRPVRIVIHMDNPAGVFQIERVLSRKIATSGIEELVEVAAMEEGREIKLSRVGDKVKRQPAF